MGTGEDARAPRRLSLILTELIDPESGWWILAPGEHPPDVEGLKQAARERARRDNDR